MPNSEIKNLSELVSQYRNNQPPQKLRLEHDDPKDLASDLMRDFSSIDLSTSFVEADDLGGFDDWLEGRDVTLFLGTGQRLFSSTIQNADHRFGASAHTLEFDSKSFDHFEARSLMKLGADIDILKGMSEETIGDLSARDIFSRIGSDQLVARFKQPEPEPEPEPETEQEPKPSQGIPEGEQPEDYQREMNPLLIYAIVGLIAYVIAR